MGYFHLEAASLYAVKLMLELQIDHEVCGKLSAKCTFDGSIIVRAELVVAMQWFIIDFENRFATFSADLSEKIEQGVSRNARQRKYSVTVVR